MLLSLILSSSGFAAEGPSVSVDGNLGLYSAYVFRGANYFGGTLAKPGTLVAPSLEVGFGDLRVGWWSGFQGSGAGRQANIRNGSGNEQDLYVSWGRGLGERASISTTLTAFWYPQGVKEEAGADAPLWVEPSAALEVQAGCLFSLSAAWYQGVQAGIAPSSYAYFTGGVAHSLSWASHGLDFGAVLGVKAPREPSLWETNTLDATSSVSSSFDAGPVTLTPSLNLTWTNGEDADIGDDLLPWVGLDTSFSR